MNSFHKIFFVGVVVLSVALGSRFNDTNGAGDNTAVSIVVSSVNEKTLPEDSSPGETINPSIPNNSTTSNSVKVEERQEAPSKSQNDNSKTVLDNAALLK